MQEMKFKVAHVKCAGCAATIREGLTTIQGVSQVAVDVSSGEVEVQGDALARDVLIAKLIALGYPLASR